jgi:hypothetical protein
MNDKILYFHISRIPQLCKIVQFMTIAVVQFHGIEIAKQTFSLIETQFCFHIDTLEVALKVRCLGNSYIHF